MAVAPAWTSRVRAPFAFVLAALCFGAAAAFAQLPPPANIVATPDCDKITVTATPVPGAIGYVIRIWPEDYNALPDIPIASLPYVDNDVPVGQHRTYWIASVDAQNVVGSFGTSNVLVARYGPAPVLDPLPASQGLLTAGPAFVLNLTGTVPPPADGTTYTWKKNGTAIPGAPNSVNYFKSPLVLADSGLYTCVVSNPCGTATSTACFLHVANPLAAPTSATATGGCNVVTINWPHVTGAWAYLVDRSPSFPPPNEGPYPGKKVVNAHQFVDHPTSAGTYHYSVYTVQFDDAFTVPPRTTGNAVVTVAPTVQIQPMPRTVETGSTVFLGTFANGTLPITYTWRKNGTNVSSPANNGNFSISNAQPSNSGSYDCQVCNSCGCVTTNAVDVHVCTTPVITVATDHRHEYANEGSIATLTTTTTLAQSMKWYRDGAPLTEGGHYTGTTLGTLTINAVTVSDEGYYELRATGECSVVTGPSIQLSVQPCYDAPVITQQPVASQAVPIGQQATISVQATGCPSQTFKWRHSPPDSWKWADVPGGNQATLVLPAITTDDLGTYFCIVANKDRYEVSDLSVLQATPTPVFGKVAGFATCGAWNGSWSSNVPISMTLQYWTGSCGNGPPSTLAPTGYTTGGSFSLPIPAGQQYFVQLSGVTPLNETVVSSCMLATAKPPGAKLAAQLVVQPYYVTMPFGTAVPVVVQVFNYGCSAYDGEISLASLNVAGIPQGALTADGDPAVPGTLLPAQIGAQQWRSFDTIYIPVTVPEPLVYVTHIISGSVLSLPSGGGLSLVQFGSQVTLSSDGPK